MAHKIGNLLACALLAAALCCCRAAAQEKTPDWSKVQIKVTKVSGNIYMLEGQGGNIAASVGEDGIVIVHDEFSSPRRKNPGCAQKSRHHRQARPLRHQHPLSRRS